jgi:hypothetical protein
VDDRGQPLDIANHELAVSLFDDPDLCKVIEFPGRSPASSDKSISVFMQHRDLGLGGFFPYSPVIS